MRRLHRRREDSRLPIRVLQVGQGNFLRAFFDQMLDIANELGATRAGVAIVKPTSRGDLSDFEEQNCLFTVILRGMKEGQPLQEGRVVRAVQRAVNPYLDFDAFLSLAEEEELRFVVSNTTEAGIALSDKDGPGVKPCPSFPGKLTQFLYHRWQFFGGDPAKGLILLPTELIDDNGSVLRSLVLECAGRFGLPDTFLSWVKEACQFLDTLVDRIVSGYPTDGEELCRQLGYEDRLLTVAEPYALWVIGCKDPEALQRELPLDAAGLPVLFTKDLAPYRLRKLRLLNGAHTGAMPLAFLLGHRLVREAMDDEALRAHLSAMLQDEVLPTIPLPREELLPFLSDVLERFSNPFLDHQILSIALNSTAKWKARLLPSIKDAYAKNGCLPRRLVFSLSALLSLYLQNPEGLRDEPAVMEFFATHREKAHDLAFVEAYLRLFQPEACQLPGLAELAAHGLALIEEQGPRQALMRLNG